jgi:multidrug efflux pump subunit AcrB
MRGPLGHFSKAVQRDLRQVHRAYTKFTNIVTRKIIMGLAFIAVLAAAPVIVGKLVPGGFMPGRTWAI